MYKKDQILSASTIKQLEDCSWLHYVKKILMVPDTGNEGASRGSNAHLILELLRNPRHLHHYTLIMRRGYVNASKAIERLVIKHLKKDGIDTLENRSMMMDMIWVGLNQDFMGNGGKMEKPEQEFLLESESPKYKIRGFIDSIFICPEYIEIRDFKSSKKRFTEDELANNIQAMTYTLASRKFFYPNIKKVKVKFIFLRFPESPIQEVSFTDEQIAGFEKYLEYLYGVVNKFSYDDARRNFAADNDKKRWLCKAGSTWKCPFLEAKAYFVLLNKENLIMKSSYSKESLQKIKKEDQSIEQREYAGCIKHNNDLFI